jgi:hypothetical protein
MILLLRQFQPSVLEVIFCDQVDPYNDSRSAHFLTLSSAFIYSTCNYRAPTIWSFDTCTMWPWHVRLKVNAPEHTPHNIFCLFVSSNHLVNTTHLLTVYGLSDAQPIKWRISLLSVLRSTIPIVYFIFIHFFFDTNALILCVISNCDWMFYGVVWKHNNSYSPYAAVFRPWFMKFSHFIIVEDWRSKILVKYWLVIELFRK